MLQKIFIVAAAICFGLGALRVQAVIDWTNAGFCLLTIGVLLL